MNELDTLIARITKNRDTLIEAIPKLGNDPKYVTLLLKSVKNSYIATTSALTSQARYEVFAGLGLSNSELDALIADLVKNLKDFVANQDEMLSELALRLAFRDGSV